MEEFVIQYFKGIATNLKEISHTNQNKAFYSIKSFPDTVNMEFNLKALKAGPVLVLEFPEGQITTNNSDNPMHKIMGAFSILIKNTNTNEEDLNKLYDDVHKIALKIFARMERDRELEILDYCELELNYQKIGPVADRYGRRYEFIIGQSISIPYNDSDWLDS